MVLRSWSRSLEVRVLDLGSWSFKVLQAFFSVGRGIFVGYGIFANSKSCRVLRADMFTNFHFL